VDPPKTPEEGYHLTEDLADKAISFIADSKQVAPDKPFFLYFCPGAMHAPHHVPKVWAEMYKGKFDDGWDAYREKVFAQQKRLGIVPEEAELSRHDPDVQDWGSLSADERKLYARMMEVYAGFLTHTDHHIGRLLDFIKEIGEFDNTLIMLISDNGASAEGGPNGSVNENKFFNNVADDLQQNLAAIDDLGGPKYFNHYPWGWAWAGNTPFRRWKRETYRGGASDPFIVHWPKGIRAKGEIRTQYAHAIDMLPTVLECLDLESPSQIRGVAQSPIEGVSFAYSFEDSEAASKRVTQYFEMLGHRSIYHSGWRAVCPWPGPSFKEAGKPFGMPISDETLLDLDAHGWELYHVDRDFAENHNVNVAAENRPRLIEMIAQWYVEAGKYNVLPVDGRGQIRLAEERPTIGVRQEHYTYYPGTQVVPPTAAPSTLNRPHVITADVEVAEGAEGVLLSAGGVDGGYSLYMKEGRLHYAYNYVAAERFHLESDRPVPEGRQQLRFEFEPTGAPDIKNGKGAPGRARLYFGDQPVGEMELPVTIPISLGLAGGISCGADAGAPVTFDYRPPFSYSGKIHKVVIDVSGELIEDKEAKMREVMAHQ
jgi:arylsulfatase A-like enzyme